MLRCSRIELGFVNGAKSPGSKHQKHVGYLPTKFLYRFAGKRGPGPVLMKYWWTLGTFPTGLEIPFRLNEFHSTYIKEHLPLEVEEWLGCVVKDPVSVMAQNFDIFLDQLQTATRDASPRRAKVVMHQGIMEPLQLAMDEVGVTVPATAVRGVAAHHVLRQRTQYLLSEYRDTIAESASTPHRRWALESGNHSGGGGASRSLLDSGTIDESAIESGPNAEQPQLSEAGKDLVKAALSFPPDETAEDERILICALTTFAQGAMVMKRPDQAVELLESALMFCHDDSTAGSVHGNLASAYNSNGFYKEASAHAQEAVVLGDRAKGYANWAVATAYLDKADEALRIADNGLQLFPESATLRTTYKNIAKAVGGRIAVDVTAQGRRFHSLEQARRATEKMPGVTFDNDFDLVRFKGKQLPAQLNPTTNGLGSDFRSARAFEGVTGRASSAAFERV